MPGLNRRICLTLCLLIATAALGGCVEKPSQSVAPTPPATPRFENDAPPAPAPQAAPKTPAKPMPGVAFGPKNYTFQASASPNDTFDVANAWETLRFTYWLESTAACYMIQNEPPAAGTTSTGAAPSLVFTGPSGDVVEFAIPTQNVCGTSTSGSITGPQGVSKDASGETGQWTVTIRGIGQNVDLRVQVDGL